jgi:hypothetical protein
MRTSKGVKPANLDLFLKLDRIISDCEAKHKFVSFPHSLSEAFANHS